jgi:nicotinamidase-related amidase
MCAFTKYGVVVGNGNKYAGSVMLAKPALLVIGMQNDKASLMNIILTTLDKRPIAGSSEFVRMVNMCIQTAHSRGWSVIYAKDLHHRQHFSFANGCGKHCVLGSWGSEHISGLLYALPNSEQIVRGVDVEGDSNDCYYITDRQYKTFAKESMLRKILSNNCEGPLFICGLSPDGCIEQTFKTASLFGHNPIIISDCTILATANAASNKTCGVEQMGALALPILDG